MQHLLRELDSTVCIVGSRSGVSRVRVVEAAARTVGTDVGNAVPDATGTIKLGDGETNAVLQVLMFDGVRSSIELRSLDIERKGVKIVRDSTGRLVSISEN